MELELCRIRRLLTAILVGVVCLIGLVLFAISLIRPNLDWSRLIIGVAICSSPVALYFVVVGVQRWSKSPEGRTVS